ncbi:MAG: response regulator [Betaproteobacteria bacterium]|nr:response regulator [Betaproteobacteria bacterium]
MRKILVVDDSPTERHLLANILTKGGYQVGVAACGEEALKITKEVMPDLILMDIVMPGLNGFQATRMISKDKATQHIPVIICSSKGLETDKIWGLRQGAKDYIIKPIIADELLQKISKLKEAEVQKQAVPKKEAPKKKVVKKTETKDYEAKVFRSRRKS